MYIHPGCSGCLNTDERAFNCGWCISAIFGYVTFSHSSADDSSISVTNLNDDHFGLELDVAAAAGRKNDDAVTSQNIGSLSKMSDDGNDNNIKITMKRMATKWKEHNYHGCCCRRRQRGSRAMGYNSNVHHNIVVA
eukprot:11166345-Ditylum_brightwellii.AAC.1